jgi:hypothetical protein
MATKLVTPALIEYFADLHDPRIDRCKTHQLNPIIVIAILAVICGAEHFTVPLGRMASVLIKPVPMPFCRRDTTIHCQTLLPKGYCSETNGDRNLVD